MSRKASKARSRAKTETGKTRRRVGAAAREASSRARAGTAAVTPKMPRVAVPRSAGDLPIDGYKSMTVDEINRKLKGLTQTELAKVYKYERAHDDRSTVLESIESRFVGLPIPTYDALNVDEINARLEGLTKDELRTIRSYEKDTKGRTTILEKVGSLL